MKLIIDSGATKADWCVCENAKIVRSVKTAGINTSVMGAEAIAALVNEAVAGLGGVRVSEVHFYGAGAIVPENGPLTGGLAILHDAFAAAFPGAEIELASDLLGAARAVCGRKPGVAAILGTGSNSCFYDGTRVVSKVAAGGFILGDEGSGARLGRLFISDYIKGLVPAEVAEPFGKQFKADYPTVVAEVYHGTAPSRYLGSFAPWLQEHKDSEYVMGLIEGNFLDFFHRCLRQYDKVPVGVVGGFGNACKDILVRLGKAEGVEFSRFVASPMEGLVDYHA